MKQAIKQVRYNIYNNNLASTDMHVSYMHALHACNKRVTAFFITSSGS